MQWAAPDVSLKSVSTLQGKKRSTAISFPQQSGLIAKNVYVAGTNQAFYQMHIAQAHIKISLLRMNFYNSYPVFFSKEILFK